MFCIKARRQAIEDGELGLEPHAMQCGPTCHIRQDRRHHVPERRRIGGRVLGEKAVEDRWCPSAASR